MKSKSNFIMALSDPSAELALVGGKGASLARLAAAGLPVPAGYHVTTLAYKLFVEANHLETEITSALAIIAPDQPEPRLASYRWMAPLFRWFKPMRIFHFQLGKRDTVTG